MHPNSNARRRLLCGLVLAAGLYGTVAIGQQPNIAPGQVKIDNKTGALVVPVGGLVQFDPKLSGPPTDIIVSREDVLQVRLDPMNPKMLLLTGRNPGLAQLTIVVKDQPKQVFDVVVQPDLELLRNLIRRTVPTANIEITPGIGNVIILSGYVTTPQDADIVSRLANSAVGGNNQNIINAVQVGGVQHVEIQVVVASVDRNEIRSRGFDFAVRGTTASFSSIIAGLTTPALGGGGGSGGLTNAASPSANLQLGIAPAGLTMALQALRSEGLAKFLAEPRVVTQSGRPANVLAGGQQAILSPSSGITGPGVTLQQIGTNLEVLPIVYGNGQIWLDVNPSVRTVNQGLGITTVFGPTPGFTENSARSSVLLESGQTFAIGGLIQNSVQGASIKVPVLGDLPFIGIGFSQIRYEERETELIILVTPRLVGPMDCNQVPKRLPGRETRSPDDYELFLENIMEAPRGQRKVWNGKCYVPAWKCDPSSAAYPCIGDVCTGSGGTCAPGAYPVGPTVSGHHGVLGAGTPAMPQTPVALPAIPGAPVGGGTGGDPVSVPSAIPPVVIPPVVPEGQRN